MRYTYSVNSDELSQFEDEYAATVSRRVFKIYPTLNDLVRLEAKGASSKLLREKMFEYTESELNKDIAAIEDKWYKVKKEYEGHYSERSSLQTQLAGVYKKITVMSDEDRVAIENSIGALNNLMTYTRAILVSLETSSPWLSGYRGIADAPEPPEIEVPEKLHASLAKRLIRRRIASDVRDSEDSISDISKLAFFSIRLSYYLYKTLTETQKKKLNKDDRQLIDEIFDAFEDHTSVLDGQMKKDGIEAIIKLFKRDEAISRIINSEK